MSYVSRRVFTGLVIASALVPALSAEAPRFGAQFSLVQPLGDLKGFNSRVGCALAATMEISLDAHQALRPRIEFTQSRDQTQKEVENIPYYSYSYTFSDTFSYKHYYLGADYLVRPSAANQGVYLFLGLGLCKSSLKQGLSLVVTDNSSGAVIDSDSRDTSSDQTRMAFSAGLGYNLNRQWGLESKLTVSDFNGMSLSWVSVGATLRF